MNVHILITCRHQDLLKFCTLVFKTFRIGFPSANLICHVNKSEHSDLVAPFIPDYANVIKTETIHHEWIESLCESEDEPFWICDTDISFWGVVENLTSDQALLGRRIPEWDDEFSGAITRSRLHPSLMRIDPVRLMDDVAKFFRAVPDTAFTPKANLFYPMVSAFNGRRYFNDTVSLLYHAIGGQSFTDKQLELYDHFNFGTIPDIVLPLLKNGHEMAAARLEAIDNPAALKGSWRTQNEYYKARTPFSNGASTVAKPSKDIASDALNWNCEICLGNQDAMFFNDIWYKYCHGIDDLIDTMEDGRPTLNKDEIISQFFNAAVLYSSRFFRENCDMLLPIVLQITNEYADSVAWEGSPKKHLRLMADAMRTCGNKMYQIVALICGGEMHMKTIGRKIQERDWLAQHDNDGYPT